jgi:hypothetical protein
VIVPAKDLSRASVLLVLCTLVSVLAFLACCQSPVAGPLSAARAICCSAALAGVMTATCGLLFERGCNDAALALGTVFYGAAWTATLRRLLLWWMHVVAQQH